MQTSGRKWIVVLISTQDGWQVGLKGIKWYPCPGPSLQEIEGASHHVYADQPHIFNAVVEEICDSVD